MDDITTLITDEMIIHIACDLMEEIFVRMKPVDKGFECPVCYVRKFGIIVETQCKHKFCMSCLDNAWKAKGTSVRWHDKPCPLCRAEVTEMKFVQNKA